MSGVESRPLVSAEDDPLFDADHARRGPGMERRASITVGDVEDIQSGRMWAMPKPEAGGR
ncbi:hypothetical protein DQ392_08680 [Streptomyces reniochalinae]|uniref:Uncharacterized protein n=1 Tax=Streptomyces reniochalinae TaxID=2250578 RepID=A0A367EUR6_9ACTN|nr:hypothetical protein DQ392_08680 [Streptomyces reniochalinae]